MAQQDGPDHCGGQHGGRVAGSVSGGSRLPSPGPSGPVRYPRRASWIKPSVYRRDMSLQPSLGVGCEPPRFYNRRRVRIDALVQAQQRVDGLVDVVRVEHAAEPQVERGEDTRLSNGKRARVFDVAGVIGPVDAAVVVVQSPVGTFRVEPCMMWPHKAHLTRPRRAYREGASCRLPPMEVAVFSPCAACHSWLVTEGGDGALDDDPGRLVGWDEFGREPRRGVVAVEEPLDFSIFAIGIVAAVLGLRTMARTVLAPHARPPRWGLRWRSYELGQGTWSSSRRAAILP